MKGKRMLLLAISMMFICVLITSVNFAQQRPKLVVGITIDQMRWDYLYRFANRWHPNGGFLRLMQQGFTCEQTHIGYFPSLTATGHASIYSGSVPAIHGITGNNWYDYESQRYLYCTSDGGVAAVGGDPDGGNMSPKQLVSNTIGDEVRLAANFRGKSIAIGLKDRSAILSGGHNANAAYWYDDESGEIMSSTHYLKALPEWVTRFEAPKKADSLYRLNWHRLYPQESYVQSVSEKKRYEVRAFGTPERQFPYSLAHYAESDYSKLPATPHGNSFVNAFAKEAITGEQLGADTITDFLAISYGATDFIGHAFGPNSQELEDAFLRLDLDLGNMIDFLDAQIGKEAYLLFVTSDHGAAHVPGFLLENKLPGGHINTNKLNEQLNAVLLEKFGTPGLSKTIVNAQVVFDNVQIEKNKKLLLVDIENYTVDWLEQQTGISRAVVLDRIEQTTLPAQLSKMLVNGHYPSRTGNIQLVYKPGYIEGFASGGTTHGSGYNYDTHIPLIWYGWQVPGGKKIYRKTSMADIAPTVAAMLQIQTPNGTVGEVITELMESYD